MPSSIQLFNYFRVSLVGVFSFLWKIKRSLIIFGLVILVVAVLKKEPLIPPDRAPTIEINKETEGFYAIGLNTEIFEDTSTNLTYEEVSSKHDHDFVTSTKKVPNPGYTKSAYWFRFRVKNYNNPITHWYLSAIALTYNLDLYYYDEDNKLVHKALGRAEGVPFTEVLFNYHTFENLYFPQGKEVEVYIRFHSKGAIQGSLNLYTPKEFAEYDHTVGFHGGGMIWVFGCFIVYNLLIFIVTRKIGYLYYCLYMIANTVFSFTYFGLTFKLWGEYAEFCNRAFTVSIPFAGLFMMLFVKDFLDTKNHVNKWFDMIVINGIIVVSILFVPLGIFGDYSFALKTVMFCYLFISILAIFISNYCAYKGPVSANIFYFAWISYLLSAVMALLKQADIIPINQFTSIGMQFGTISEILLLSIALAYRINEMRKAQYIAEKEKSEAQKKAFDALDKAQKKIIKFVMNASHELRTPGIAILGFAENILDGSKGEVPQPILRSLFTIKNSTTRFIGQISNMLDITKIMSEKSTFSDAETFDPREVVKHVIETSGGLVIEEPIEIDSNIPDNIPLVFTGKKELTQVLLNLVGNAIKFTEQGSITISAMHSNNILEFTVTDTGIGIKPENTDRIFEMFEQEDDSTGRKYGGSGLGLAIVKGIVEFYSGSIRVESVYGEGSKFIFSVPISENQNTSQVDSSASSITELTYTDEYHSKDKLSKIYCEHNSGVGTRILIVDDEPTNVETLIEQLADDYHILAVPDGQTALDVLNSFNPDSILLDIMMPGINGFEVCRKIRKHNNGYDCPIIMLTAKVQDEDLVEGFNAEANDFIKKPWKKIELKKRVQASITMRELVKSLLDSVRQQQELLTATTVQQLLIPAKSPNLTGINIAQIYQPASETGGDWYDFRFHEDTNNLDVLIADVTGHGVQAAIITAIVAGWFKGSSAFKIIIDAVISELKRKGHDQLQRILEVIENHREMSPGESLSLFSDLLYNITDGLYPVTFCYSTFDFNNMTISLSVAAHTPVIHIRPGGFTNEDEKERKKKRAFPLIRDIQPKKRGNHLGGKYGNLYQEEIFPIKNGDIFLLYTDCLVESESPKDDKQFGVRRLKNILTNAVENKLSLDEMLSNIQEELKKYVLGSTYDPSKDQRVIYDDDLTVILVQVMNNDVKIISWFDIINLFSAPNTGAIFFIIKH